MMSSSRRQFIRRSALGALGASVPTIGAKAQEITKTPPSTNPPGQCTLFPEAVEGPYYFDPKLVRSDITDGRRGQSLRLTLRVIESGTCTPVANSRVDIWHADADGVYSGYDRQGDARNVSAKGASFLRGSQFSDATGTVKFETIYPGWYPGRTPHIHLKIYLDEKTVLTGQMYFEDTLSAAIYRDHVSYKTRPRADTTNARDGIFRDGEKQGGGIVFASTRDGDALAAALLITVNRNAKPSGMMRRLLGR